MGTDGAQVFSSMDERAAEMGSLSDVMNRLMESAIEQTILQAKIKEIYGVCIERTQSETQILELKMDRLRGKPQAFFGIKPELERYTDCHVLRTKCVDFTFSVISKHENVLTFCNLVTCHFSTTYRHDISE